jgi:hypothetical protein
MNYKDFLRQEHSAARRVWNEQAEATGIESLKRF